MIDGPLFSIGKLHFYPYGMCMALGIILCFVFLMYTFTKRNFNDEAVDKILIIGIGATAFGIFMAMVFQALYDYIEDPSQKFSLGGSMTFQGGLIGGVVSFLIVWNLYVFVIAPRTKIKILQNNMNATLTDALPFIHVGIAIAHAFGRLGCFFGRLLLRYGGGLGALLCGQLFKRNLFPRSQGCALAALRNVVFDCACRCYGCAVLQGQVQL